MTTLAIAPGVYLWTLQYEDGTTRTVLGSSADSVIGGVPHSAVVVATRGPVFTEIDDVPPVVGSLVPATAEVGTPGFTLHVHGTGFKPGATILGSPLVNAVTTFVSATELTTVVPSTALAPGSIPISVRTVAGQVSNELPFALQPAP